jgi:hypothetical protein
MAGGTGAKNNTGGDSCGAGCTYSACVATSCDAGYYKNGNVCAACGDGTYKASASNATSCSTCPGSSSTVVNGGVKSKSPRTSINDCYIQGKFTDAGGTFEVSGDSCIY